MNSLQDSLNAIKEAFKQKAPPEAQKIMHDATASLIASGLHEKALGTGSEFPDFNLVSADGATMSSSEIIGSGPVIVNFFRGFW